jgi:hypothetical protein
MPHIDRGDLELLKRCVRQPRFLLRFLLLENAKISTRAVNHVRSSGCANDAVVPEIRTKFANEYQSRAAAPQPRIWKSVYR